VPLFFALFAPAVVALAVWLLSRNWDDRFVLSILSVPVLLVMVPIAASPWLPFERVTMGNASRLGYVLGTSADFTSFLDVAWVSGDSERSLPLKGRDCLMYLGQANGTSVFYDARTRESVRLPSGNIVVSFRYTFFVPDSCL
jgi:hypothetical protein